MKDLHKFLKLEMRYTQDRQKQNANASRTPALAFQIDNLIWVSTKNIKTARPSKKLDHQRMETFSIIEVVSPHAFRLGLPPSMKIHPVFHVSLLEPASSDPTPDQVIPPLPPVEIEGHEEWEVEEVLDFRTSYRKPQYLVKWLGWDAPTWQLAHNLKNAPANVQRFHHLHPTKPGPW